MDVPAGQVLGLMGKDGSGKSSLAALMMRWRTPTVGSVSIDGVDVHQYDQSYTREVAYIGQEPVIFSKSIRENIAFGMMNMSSGMSAASEEQVLKAAQLADAHRFIRLLPEGYNTVSTSTSAYDTQSYQHF
jgi:ABC-type bacteriocin/lantibiotic exporter with double-glycine peptidase domain